jgi:hypothetical protein
MIATVTLTTAGISTSLFDIYSNSDNFTTPIISNVDVASLLSGVNVNIPDNSTEVRVQSLGGCVNYIDITLT